MIKSRFEITTLRPLIFFLFLSFGIGMLSMLIFTSLMSLYIYFLYAGFVAIWLLLLRVLQKRIVLVKIDGANVISSGFFGLGISSTYSFNELDGYKTSNIASRYGFVEHLFLMKDEKKVIKIGADYHRNYQELKAAVQPFLSNLGYEQYHIKNEFKEIFR